MRVTKRDLDAILTVASILFLGLTPEGDDKKMFKELREISNIADELDSRMLCSEANMLDSILKNSNLNSAGLMSLPLKNGDRGRLVYNAQAKLLQYGYHMDAGADGIFGKQTEAAIKEFQAENNFNETGLLTRGQYNLLINGEPNKASYKRIIVAIGDSITAGGYARNLQTKVPGSRTFTFGYGGKQTGFIKKKMSLALDKNPSDIIILAGVNDIASGKSSKHIQDNLKEMYDMAIEAGARVIAVKILPWHGRANSQGKEHITGEVNEWIDSYVSSLPRSDGHTVIQPIKLYSDNPDKYEMNSEYTKDRIHPNKKGKDMLAEIIADQAFGEEEGVLVTGKDYAEPDEDN